MVATWIAPFRMTLYFVQTNNLKWLFTFGFGAYYVVLQILHATLNMKKKVFKS